MKRTLSFLMALLMLIGLVGCCKPGKPDFPEPLTYTDIPTEMTTVGIGVMSHRVLATPGGLYYQEGGKYGIMTFDGKVDSGAIYTFCQPMGTYFLVSESNPRANGEATSMNVTGAVDAAGNVLIPLRFAQITAMDDRFVRAVEITGTANSEADGVTYYLNDKGEKVHCAGTYYIYDMQTGKAIPGATGTTRYAAYTYGTYVKYVTDDQEQVVCTPDGEPVPDKAVHLLNGYYAIQAEHTVYDGNNRKVFTYDPDGYIPCESKDVDGYIVAKKAVDGQDRYVLMDLTGQVVTAPLEQPPLLCGSLLYVNKQLVTFEGKPVVDGTFNQVYRDKIFGQSWVVENGKNRQIVKKDGTVIGTGDGEQATVDPERMLVHKMVDDQRMFYCLAEDDFSIAGTAAGPFLVKVPREDYTYDLVNVLSGQVVLSGYSNYTTSAMYADMLYVYAQNAEGLWEIIVVR